MRHAAPIIALLLPVANVAHADKSLLNVTGSVWSPYIDQTLPNYGVAAELVGTALRRAGYELSPKVETWSRAERGVTLGVYDVVVAVWRSEERAHDLAFSQPYLLNDIVFFAPRGVGGRYTSLDDLIGQRIGVVHAYAYHPAFDNHRGLTKIGNNHLVQNLLLLKQGKLDLVVGDKWALLQEVSRFMPNDADAYSVVPNLTFRRGLRMGVAKAHPEHQTIVADFDQTIQEMNRDGTYKAIVEKHTGGFAVLAGSR